MADTSRDVSDLSATVAALTQERDELRAAIDATWFHIEHGYDIEPRDYFEKEAPKNGFRYALAQAIHHIWKREPKVAALTVEQEALKSMAELRLRSFQRALSVLKRIAVVIEDTPPCETVDESLPSLVAFVVEERRKAIAEVTRLSSALQQAQTWQPIATLEPLIEVLLWGPLWRGVMRGMWLNAPVPGVVWLDGDGGGFGHGGATHWMPLPAPPVGDAK